MPQPQSQNGSLRLSLQEAEAELMALCRTQAQERIVSHLFQEVETVPPPDPRAMLRTMLIIAQAVANPSPETRSMHPS